MTGRLLVLVALVIEHSKRNDEEDKYGINDVNSEPQILHRERKVAGAVINRVAARLPVGHVGREHENGDGGNREPQNDDEFGEIGLVDVIRVLVIDEEVDIEYEHQNADDNRHNH